jgi:transglutaminase-like putative cysteine protease
MDAKLRPPPFLLGAVLVFWGWQTGYLLVGTGMGAILESTVFLRWRWDFAEEDFTRIWTLCSLLLLTATIYAFTANESAADLFSFLQDPNFFTQRRAGNSSARAVAALMQWQPMIFFPFMAAAAFNLREGIPLRTISLILQKRWKRAKKLGQPLPESPTIQIGYIYFGLCLFSASIQSNEGLGFFWGVIFLLFWALWPHRSKRFGLPAYATVVLAAVVLSYYGQVGMADVQQFVGSLNPQWFSRYGKPGFDPREARTMIGKLGRVKLSHSIVVRLETPSGSRAPSLLREASYRQFQSQVWTSTSSRSNEFETMPSETNQTTFILLPDKPASEVVKIACYLPGGSALLPLPRGTTRLEQLPAFLMQTNRLGAVLAEGPGLVIFDARHGPGASIDSRPEPSDTNSVPRREVPALRQVISEANLAGRPLEEAMRLLNAYFQRNFTYSTWQPGRFYNSTNPTPLSAFLLQHKSGHCEYFATATVLLLRQLGFPARYAVGYAVHERNGENSYVVRQSDAHSWCLVWHNGRWQDFDTTPGSWFAVEEERAPTFQTISDFFSRIAFEFSKIRWGQSHLRSYLLWSLLPVLAILLFQTIYRGRRSLRVQVGKSSRPVPTWPGLDSDFYELERSLRKHGLARQSAEGLVAWVDRVVTDQRVADAREMVREVLQLHYRYRFDPLGLNESERGELRRRSRECVDVVKARLKRKPASKR